MVPVALLLLAPLAAPHAPSFEITSNKPFVPVTVNGSAPQWFILDTGNNGPTIIARECADRLRLARGAEARVDVGGGSGADVGLAQAQDPVTLKALGETLTVAEPRVLTLGHVSRVEGRRVDGLLGADFLMRHVVEIDYATRRITLHDPAQYAAPFGAPVVPLHLDTGWPVVEGTITPAGGSPIPCRLIVDTGVRFTVAMFRPFSARYGLHEGGALRNVVIGVGAGGVSHGDVGRVDALALGPVSVAQPVAMFSRDTTGVFSLADPVDGIVGGELLRRYRVTFDCPHARMILEPYGAPAAFEYDMSGVFLTADGPDFTTLRVLAVAPDTPGATAGLQVDDEIVAIDGRRAPRLSLDQARELLRAPGARRLEIRRGGQVRRVRLEARRLV